MTIVTRTYIWKIDEELFRNDSEKYASGETGEPISFEDFVRSVLTEASINELSMCDPYPEIIDNRVGFVR